MERPVLFLLCLAIAYLPAVYGSRFAGMNRGWFARVRPRITPPDWAFPVVWGALYFAIGVSLYLLWLSRADMALIAILFAANLVLNALWTALFFGERQAELAMADLTLLWLCTGVLILYAWGIERTAALLLLAYLAWLTYAGVLNALVIRKMSAPRPVKDLI